MDDKDTLGIPFWWQRCGCIRKPSYSTGEQIAMQSEIDDLRKELKRVTEELYYTEDALVSSRC